VREASAEQAPELDVPYRSTLKKLQAHWVGDLKASIEGQPTLAHTVDGQVAIEGIISNRTGQDLRDVYLAFKAPIPPAKAGPVPFEDRIWYLPLWKNGVALDLKQVRTDRDTRILVGSGVGAGYPGQNRRIRDAIYYPGDPRRREGWTGYWFGNFANSGFGGERGYDDSTDHWRFTYPMLSLFDRLPAMKTTWNSQTNKERGRVEFLRRGARYLDLSAPVAAGNLVILGQAEDDRGPLPFPLTVRSAFGEDVKVVGQGVTFYQAVLPLGK
jgi:hypothetical protein